MTGKNTVNRNGRGSPYYGQLMTETLPSEVKKIWYSRDEELPELPRHKWSWQLQDDMDLVEAKDLLFKILADAALTDREMLVIKLIVHDELTLKEAGHELGCTQERARQIYLKGMRKLRRHQQKITGVHLWELDCDVTTWNHWKWSKRCM
jgi:RNA polymerase sigma factor (sigma-70 family)